MWTPKRILILLTGSALFTLSFAVYFYFLGGIDGLAPLPESYLQIGGEPPPFTSGDLDDQTDKRIRMAFGNECPELKRPKRFFFSSKGILLSVSDYEIMKEDGRINLVDFSVALFPKGRPNSSFPEINTITSKRAIISLDRPIASIAELKDRKIMAVELEGPGIKITNNRRTPLRSDDVVVNIEGGSLYYEEPKDLIWSNGYIKMEEYSPDPENTLSTLLTQITAQGFDLHLSPDTSPNRGKDNRPAKQLAAGQYAPMSGVEKMVLKSNIFMLTTVDAKSGFMGGGEEPGKKADPKKGVDKRLLNVTTNGEMTYDLINEQVVFNHRPSDDPAMKDKITVSRRAQMFDASADYLLCDHLTLKFRRKDEPGKPAEKSTGTKEVTFARATGKEVTLTLIAEALAAQGTELLYKAPTAKTGPQTILKGDPMNAIKDGHKIQSKELHIVGANAEGKGKQAFAKGPGVLDLFDKKDPARPYLHHLFWDDYLTSTEDAIDDKLFEKIILVGDAAFHDDDKQNQLHSQRLEIWLEQVGAFKENKDKAKNATRHRIHKVEAFDNVTFKGPELLVNKSNRLTLVFKEMSAVGVTIPDSIPRTPTPASPASLAKELKEAPVTAMPLPPAIQQIPPTTLPATSSGGVVPLGVIGGRGKSKHPIQLEASEITVYVATFGTRTELQEVSCQGAVHVHQAADDPKSKGLDILGETLVLIHNPGGHTLIVLGEYRVPAKLQMGEMKLIGPKITIKQIENLAVIEGAGAMILPSNTKLDGSSTGAKNGTLTVTWLQFMSFNGNLAYFQKGVQAFQEPEGNKAGKREISAMKCENMQVTLDQTISFKDGQKPGENAKVEKVVCDDKVFIEDIVRVGNNDKIQSYSRLIARQVEVNNASNRFVARALLGQGQVDYLGLSANEAPGAKSTVPITNLTRVQNWEYLVSLGTATGRESTFIGDVEVFHVPSEDPNVSLQTAKIPKDGFYLRCANLKIFSQKIEGTGGKMKQNIIARDKVQFQTEEFYGTADVVKFDESTDLVIFEGEKGNTVTLTKISGPAGQPRDEWRGTKILYNRRTQQLSAEGGSSITGGLSGPQPFTPTRPKQ